jgi:predicted nucleic acid-binding Zn ribbon protein
MVAVASKVKECPECGLPNPEDQKQCSKCGHDFTKSSLKLGPIVGGLFMVVAVAGLAVALWYLVSSSGNTTGVITNGSPRVVKNLPPPALPVASIPGKGSRSFPETGKTVNGIFLDYWNKTNGLSQHGFPISDVIQEVADMDGNQYAVQYFERSLFEYHPELPPDQQVQLSQLGRLRYRQKYPNGALNQTKNLGDGKFFPETSEFVGGKFWQFWQERGGLTMLGYPVSQEFYEVSSINGKAYVVQYFERAILEAHPENKAPDDVLLAQLGTLRYKEKYVAK